MFCFSVKEIATCSCLQTTLMHIFLCGAQRGFSILHWQQYDAPPISKQPRWEEVTIPVISPACHRSLFAQFLVDPLRYQTDWHKDQQPNLLRPRQTGCYFDVVQLSAHIWSQLLRTKRTREDLCLLCMWLFFPHVNSINLNSLSNK